MNEKAEAWEGQAILDMLEGWDPNDPHSGGDELTRGRVRTIYTRVKYGGKSAREIASYYGLQVNLVQDIVSGKVFPEITGATR